MSNVVLLMISDTPTLQKPTVTYTVYFIHTTIVRSNKTFTLFHLGFWFFSCIVLLMTSE
jgi:hypothetical protein